VTASIKWRYATFHFPSLQTNLGNAFRHNGYGTERIGSKKDNLRASGEFWGQHAPRTDLERAF